MSFQLAVELPLEWVLQQRAHDVAFEMGSELKLSLMLQGEDKCFSLAVTVILNWLAYVLVLLLEGSLCFTISSLAAALPNTLILNIQNFIPLCTTFHFAKHLSSFSGFHTTSFLDHLLCTIAFSMTAHEFPSHCRLSCPGKPSAVFTLPGRLCKWKVVDRNWSEVT